MSKLKFKTDELDNTYVGDCLLDCIFEHNYQVAFYMCKSLFIDAYEEIDENQDFKEIIKYIKAMVREDFEETQYRRRKIIKELNELDVDEFKKVCLEYFYEVVQDDKE